MVRKVISKFFPYNITKENMERPKIAKDKHKIKLKEMKFELNIMKEYLSKCKKNELATRQSNH